MHPRTLTLAQTRVGITLLMVAGLVGAYNAWWPAGIAWLASSIWIAYYRLHQKKSSKILLSSVVIALAAVLVIGYSVVWGSLGFTGSLSYGYYFLSLGLGSVALITFIRYM